MNKYVFLIFLVFISSMCITFEDDYSAYTLNENYSSQTFKLYNTMGFVIFNTDIDCFGYECVNFLIEKYNTEHVAISILVNENDDKLNYIKKYKENIFNTTPWSKINIKSFEEISKRKYKYFSQKDNIRIDYIFEENDKLFEVRIRYSYDTECFFLVCKEEEAMEKLDYIENVVEPEFFENFELK